jgi:hypothetical protein
MGLRYLQVRKSIQCGFDDVHFVISYFPVPFLSKFIEPPFLNNWSCEFLNDISEVGKFRS